MGLVNLAEYMPNGMNPDWRQRINVPAFDVVRNLQAVGRGGLKQFYPFNTMDGIVAAFPWPQLFLGNRVFLGFLEDAIVDLFLGGPVTLYDFSTFDYTDDTADTATIPPGGGEWHFCDFYTTWAAFNGNCVVFKTAFSDKVFVATEPKISTAAVIFEGRMVMAGFDSSDSIWSTMKTFLEANESQLPDQAKGLYAGLDSTWAQWTGIGGPEFLGMFNFNLLKYGWFDDTQNTGYSDAKSLFLSLLKKNQHGARPLLHYSDACKVLTLGRVAVVYQEGGATGLWPYDEPWPTFGIRNPATDTLNIDNLPKYIGPAGRGCVNGNDDVHIFVSPEFDLWRVSRQGFRAENAQYSHKLKVLQPETIRISLDPVHKDFYICGLNQDDELTSFCYSHSGGLTECPKATSCIFLADKIYGVWEDTATPTDVIVRSMPISSSHPALGGIPGRTGAFRSIAIETIAGDSSLGWRCRVAYRLNNADEWSYTDYKSFDSRGKAEIPAPGIEWMAEVVHDDWTKTNGIEGFWVEIDLEGKIPARVWLDASTPTVMQPPTP